MTPRERRAALAQKQGPLTRIERAELQRLNRLIDGSAVPGLTRRQSRRAVALVLAILGSGGGCITYKQDQVVVLRPDDCIRTGLQGQAMVVLQDAVTDWNGVGAHLVLADAKTPLPEGAAVLAIECAAEASLNQAPAESDPDAGVFTMAEYDSVNARILFDRASWDAAPPPAWTKLRTDFTLYENVIDHEIGHAYGLAHVLDSNSVMYWSAHVYRGFSSQDVDDFYCAQQGLYCQDVNYDTENH